EARGLDTVSAVLEAGRIRLRPILMTSVATIMGAVPVAWGVGAGSAARKPRGYAIVGGVFFSTALTLFVVPVGYILLDRLTARKPSGVRVTQPVEADRCSSLSPCSSCKRRPSRRTRTIRSRW